MFQCLRQRQRDEFLHLHYIPVIIANYQKGNSLLDRILQKLKCSSASPVAIRFGTLCVHMRQNRDGTWTNA